MKKLLLSTFTISLFFVAGAKAACFNTGPIVLRGTVVKEPLTMADDSISSVWILHTETPICINELTLDGEIKPTNTSKFQVIGTPPPAGIPLELTGNLTTGNYTQYYAVPDAIVVKKGRKLNSSVVATEPNAATPNELSKRIDTPTPRQRVAPIEKDAVLADTSEKYLKAVDQLVILVRQNGYSCNSVSAAIPMLFSNGFNFTCDNFRHKYDIKDMGGHWTVTVNN